MSEQKKVLIIDDDQSVHTILRFILQKMGLRIVTAYDGMQGLMLAKTSQPDLIILDIMMPASNGLTVHDRLQESEETSHIPILIYSAVPYNDIVKKVKPTEKVQILSKPDSPDKVMHAINTLFRST